MYTEGYVDVEYAKVDGKIDRTNIEKMTKGYPDSVKTKEQAIDYVYNDKL